MIFMVSALIFEAISVRSVTAVLGLNWHKYVYQNLLLEINVFSWRFRVLTTFLLFAAENGGFVNSLSNLYF